MNEETALLIRRLWFRNGKILLAEFVLLGISFAAAFAPLNGYNTAVNVFIAALMALMAFCFSWVLSGKAHSCGLLGRAESSG
jgi:hypothetical protein